MTAVEVEAAVTRAVAAPRKQRWRRLGWAVAASAVAVACWSGLAALRLSNTAATRTSAPIARYESPAPAAIATRRDSPEPAPTVRLADGVNLVFALLKTNPLNSVETRLANFGKAADGPAISLKPPCDHSQIHQCERQRKTQPFLLVVDDQTWRNWSDTWLRDGP